MQLSTNRSKLVKSEAAQSTFKASIQLSPFMLQILSRDLYQKNIESPFREILINAIDAHIEAGVDLPVDVHLPTIWDEQFYIRDYGKGLSKEQIEAIYLDYGNSTRRETNEQHGGLGLGTKSPFAYTTSFSVVSYHQGIARTYLFYLDEDHMPAGDLTCEEKTDEPSGLKVTFSVNNSGDASRFQTAAEQLLRYIPSDKVNIVNDSVIKIKNKQYPIGTTYGPITLFHNETGLRIVMGYVAYTVNEKAVLDYFNNSATSIHVNGNDINIYSVLKSLLSVFAIEIKADIGEYQVHPSREYINITPKTTKQIITAVQEAATTLFNQEDKVDFSTDILKFKLTCKNQYSFDDKPIRVRLLVKDTYSYTNRVSIPNQIVTYGTLISALAEFKRRINVCFLSTDDMTDYVGSKRNYYIWPYTVNPSDIILFVNEQALNEAFASTGDSFYTEFLAECKKFNVIDLSDDIEEYRRQKTTIPVAFANTKKSRTVVRSMQDPQHNILLLNPCCYNYNPGTQKRHWRSSKESVSSLKDLKRPIFWLPTRMGCADVSVVQSISRLARYYPIIPNWKKPIIIGLPASKGTLSFEREFQPISELDKWIDDFIISPYANKRIKLRRLFAIIANASIDYELLRNYGTANILYKLNKLAQKIPYVNYEELTQFPEQNIIEQYIEELKIRFPYTSRYIDSDMKIKIANWAKELADLTNNHPTGVFKP